MEQKKIRSLIIDDDPFIRDLLEDKLSQYIPEVELIASASSGTEGIELIKQFSPELIFLDVEMADMTGFEMLSMLHQINFQTIFITSYSHYAIKAIRFNALDYLVKPIDLGELKLAIKRYRHKKSSGSTPEKIQSVLQNIQTRNVSDLKLILKTQEGELNLTLKDIIRIEGERNYSFIYLKNEKKKLVTKTLADLDDLLKESGFFRCHRSFIVNQTNIMHYPNAITLIMSDGVEIPISRRKKNEFKLWLSQYR
jgi:two-component system LytT family response regulator